MEERVLGGEGIPVAKLKTLCLRVPYIPVEKGLLASFPGLPTVQFLIACRNKARVSLHTHVRPYSKNVAIPSNDAKQ